NDFISFVAVTDDDEIIAHNAFERREDYSVPEIGVAFTKPEYRGRGCLNKLTIALLEEAEKQKFIGIFALGITTHPFSQKTLIKFGFRDCALYLSKGKERIYKSIEQKKPQRESPVLFFRYVTYPEKLVIYPPAHHLKMIAGLYEHIGFKPEINTTDIKTTPEIDKSVISVKTNLSALTADLTVKTFGKDILPEVFRIFKELCINRTETIYLRLRLNDPFTANYTAEFEKMGFFFCGILPRSEGNDELILQYLNNYIIDYDQLKIASEKEKKYWNT
ncbi:MAG: GNAT family N-acetyltransferase, partial [Bacteroidales bacterium]|nr:GNAT family N-acetyltransferase [Bacteroidales bacterium]